MEEQSTILLFGGSQNTGLETARLLTARGDHVRALVRPVSDRSGLEACGAALVEGNVLDHGAVEAAFLAGPIDAVVWTIGGTRGGPRPDVAGVRNLIAAAEQSRVKRVVMVTAVGAGDSRDALSDRAWSMLGKVIELKTEAENLLTASELDWTILRPGGMGSGPATGTAIKTEDHAAMGMIQRADLAQLIVDCLDDAGTVGRIYHAIDPQAADTPPLQREADAPG